MEPVIKIENLSKSFVVHGKKYHNSLFNFLIRKSSISATKSIEQVQALCNVSLDVFEGDVIGFVGKNGAGKSTLFKILSEVLLPTSGSVKIKGTVASVLEVGTGLHAELTGRENIHLVSSLYNMPNIELISKIEQIIQFSELGDFIDMPLKKYSAGMTSRLAFSIFANIEADILILDEALSTGDSSFKMKCYYKIEQLIKQGKTILFATHELNDIARFCTRVVVMNKGEIIAVEKPREAIAQYLDLIFNNKSDLANFDEDISSAEWRSENAPICDVARVLKVSVFPHGGEVGKRILTSDIVCFTAEVECLTDDAVDAGFVLSHKGSVAAAFGTVNGNNFVSLKGKGKYMLTFKLQNHILNSTMFFADFVIVKNQNQVALRLPGALCFSVYKSDSSDILFDFKGPFTFTSIDFDIKKS